ncbi:MAG: hypothetical protein K9J21_06920 [Bacteroidales bacterium]|nr:hypothetical protein [Bacteroidales bacterium]
MKIKPAKNQDIFDVTIQLTGKYDDFLAIADASGKNIDHKFDGQTEFEIPQQLDISFYENNIRPSSAGVTKGDFNSDYNNDFD